MFFSNLGSTLMLECYRNPYGPLRVNVIVTRMGFVRCIMLFRVIDSSFQVATT